MRQAPKPRKGADSKATGGRPIKSEKPTLKIGQAIQKELKSKNLAASSVETAIGLKPKTLSNLMRRRSRIPSWDVVYKVAKWLRIDARELV